MKNEIVGSWLNENFDGHCIPDISVLETLPADCKVSYGINEKERTIVFTDTEKENIVSMNIYTVMEMFVKITARGKGGCLDMDFPGYLIDTIELGKALCDLAGLKKYYHTFNGRGFQFQEYVRCLSHYSGIQRKE